MSNRRKLKKPRKPNGPQFGAHYECPSCGGPFEINCVAEGEEVPGGYGTVDELGVTDDVFLAAMQFKWAEDCPACGTHGALKLRLGRQWLGEPEKMWECDQGCAPSVIRSLLLEAGAHAECLGDFGMAGERTALYHIYDARDELLYVGISKDFGTRWKQHAKAQPWWPDVERQTVKWYGSRPDAEAAEKVAIKLERPKYNKAHAIPVSAEG